MSLQVSLPDHVFIINKISLFTSNLRREKQNEPQMPAIVYFLIYLFFVGGFFCYFWIPLQKPLVQTLTLILKQITRITNRAQPDYVRNGALKKGKKRRQVTAQINMTCTLMRVPLASRRMVTNTVDILPI